MIDKAKSWFRLWFAKVWKLLRGFDDLALFGGVLVELVLPLGAVCRGCDLYRRYLVLGTTCRPVTVLGRHDIAPVSGLWNVV